MHLRQSLRPWMLVASMLLLTILLPASMRADSFTIVTLGSDQGRFLYGLDDAGTVVIDTSNYCSNTCYATFVDGTYAGTSVLPPALQFDDGSACSPTIAGYVVQAAVCNHGSVIWTGYQEGKRNSTAVYRGLDPTTGEVAQGGEGPLLLNSTGDFAWDDHFSEQFYEALGSTVTPEPGSLLLLATGLVAGGAEAFRRRRCLPSTTAS